MTNNEHNALVAIAYLNLSHLPLEEQVATLRDWARMALDGDEAKYKVVTTDAFNKLWAQLTPDTTSN
jgi:hypothetical protein